MPLEEIVVGREPADLEKYGKRGTIFLGKHVVGTGFETHTANPVRMDVTAPHVMMIVGKRGSGKSYSGAVIAEEIMNLPEAERNNLSVVMIDTMGIYWSMKEPNDPALLLLKDWGMQPKGFPSQNIVPAGLTSIYRRMGIPFDGTFAIKTNELSVADWSLTFGLNPYEPLGILLERVLRKLKDEEYGIEDIIGQIEKDDKAEAKEKLALVNRFTAAQGWGIFSEEATPVDKFLTPGIATVIDISLQEWNVRNLMLGMLARKIYQARVAARREEETAAIGGRTVRKVPLTWILMDAAHNFIPSEGATAATGAMLTLVREGRQPGISTVFITQRPNRLHEDVIAQSDLIISHRLTSKQDLNALSAITQTYLLEDLRKSIADMPKAKGAAVILDDNSERLFNIQVRPRQSWHAGGTPTALASTA
jgi:DNA helicase HerA-like ATPase